MISLLYSNSADCVKLSDEDYSRYSNKIKLVHLGKCHYLTKKVMSP